MDYPSNLVCRLRKSLYGLKHTSRQWYEKLVHSLQSQGFHKSHLDHNLFIEKQDEDICVAIVYKDDVIVMGTNEAEIETLKSHLHHEFSI